MRDIVSTFRNVSTETDQAHGVVLEFAVLPEADNPLCVAMPVVYSSRIPSPFTFEQLLDSIVGLRQLELDQLCVDYARVKSDEWSYEREWRVWDISPARGGQLFEDVRLKPRELVGLYLGCRTEAKPKRELLAALREHHPHAVAYQAHQETDVFGLRFERVS